jgi:threonine/homoserine/homoserine lactone efflux protein
MWHDDRNVKPFWTGYLLSISLCMDLGIVNVAAIRVALTQGGMAAFLLGLGSCVGDLIYFTLAALGAATLARWAPVRWGLWLFGTSVLLYLSWKMAREAAHPRRPMIDDAAPQSHQGRRPLFCGSRPWAEASSPPSEEIGVLSCHSRQDSPRPGSPGRRWSLTVRGR